MSGMLQYIVLCNITDAVDSNGNSDGTGNKACPSFQPFAMLGGVIWCFGNILVVPIVKLIGLGLGISLWGSINLLGGWATGKFGLFGLKADSISNPTLNFVGVFFSVCAVVIFLFIKPTLTKSGAADGNGAEDFENDDEDMRAGLIKQGDVSDSDNAADSEASWVDGISPALKKPMGVLLAIISGVCYSQNFTPPSYVAQHPDKFPGASSDLSAYVLPHFCGIAMTSTAFMLIYAGLKKNAPVLYPSIVLPGFLSGTVWSIAQISWFVANARLSLSIAFPLIAAGPGVVGAIWGAAVFGEITGRKNLALLGIAFVCVAASAVFISLSK